MGKKHLFPITEHPAKVFMTSISIIGWVYVGIQFFQIESWRDPWIYGLLLIFLAICEYYPMPVWKGFTTISFPVVYVIYVVYGLPIAAIGYALIIFIINIMNRRPFRIVFFNPAQLVISFSLAAIVSQLMISTLNSGLNLVVSHIIELLLLSILFYVLNNAIVDIVLLLRPQRYPFQIWKQKFLSEVNSLGISIFYGCLFLILGSQNRGHIDVFTFFFFFSPLVGLALLSSSIVRLRKERNRLKALFSLTSDLNKMLPTKNWLDALKSSIHELIDVEAIILWTNDDGKWKISYEKGKVNTNATLTNDVITMFQDLKQPLIIADSKRESVLTESYFDQQLRSFVYAPLVIDWETVGVFALARSRTKSFNHEEVQAIATLANQLAVIIKTRMLIEEKEKRSLLEERNRIARDIHDGVAQTIAGALMKLETAQRKWEKSPEETYHLLTDSMDKLRGSLKQVRQSIYALRPYPTDRVGLQPAINQRIKTFERETGLMFTFEERGKVEPLSSMVEKILFDTFQESVQNIVKHANATKVEILLSYQKEHILLRVKDNGSGFSLLEAMMKAQKEPHFGILQMNDSAEKIGASLQIDSRPEQGTELSIIVPKMGIEGGFEHD
jgi:signal transduction histidine kinase